MASSPVALSESLLARFRAVAYERLSRVDGAWAALTRGQASPGAEDALFRDVHTLKGDARVVGFSEVAFLSERLEDLLSAARDRGFRVHEDVDVVVTMAIQFIGLLLRKRAGTAKAAIDIEGFVAQVDQATAEWLRRRSMAPGRRPSSGPPLSIKGGGERIPHELRRRLARVATLVFLEHLRSTGAARDRLMVAWEALAGEIAELEVCALGPTLQQHAEAAERLAGDLGKIVEVRANAGDLRVGAEVLEALSVAVLHALRNAVDHGLEPPEERLERGKPATGSILVTATEEGDTVEVVVTDDGRGVNFDRVRRRAVELGLLTDAAARRATEAELLEMLFAPAFSTREVVSEVSGRGVGLDAVRSGIVGVSGGARLTTQPGVGTTLTLRVRQPRVRTGVLVFRAPGCDQTLAVDESWTPEIVGDPSDAPLDLAALLVLPVRAERPAAGSAVTLRLRRSGAAVSLAVAEAPQRGTALRVCPTSPEEGAEVVELGAQHGLLLRPDVLAAAARRGGPGGDR